MNIRTIRGLAIGGMLALAASASHAAFVDSWDYVLDLHWANPSPNGAGITLSNDARSLSWGYSGGDYHDANQPQSLSSSGLEITQTPAAGAIATHTDPNTKPGAVPVNIFTHYNNIISTGFTTLTAAQLVSTITLRPSDNASVVAHTITTSFDVYFLESENTNRNCVPDSQSICDDVFAIAYSPINGSFEYDGVTYTFSYFDDPSLINPISDAACSAAHAPTPCVGFLTPEQDHTTVQFAFSIRGGAVSPPPGRGDVPEPGVLALFGIGLAGLSAVYRRRRA
ncbi:MAG: PEP-CTERM sorting domain-containing protein [Azoarcus sp.]|jgi:hypothetical protein|nr:PEP-CTERM sorting domain-containing protein [Azoarcus sp.]